MANIRTARRSGFVLRDGKNRRETFWVGIAPTTTTLATATPVLFTGFGADSLALRPFTIIRTRGVLNLSSDQVAATEPYLAAFGMAVVSDQALAVGVTAVPTPINEAGSDLWFLYESLTGAFTFGDATGRIDSAGTFKEFDSKAMRKVEDGQDLAIVMEASGAGTFEGCNMAKHGRMLIKLH